MAPSSAADQKINYRSFGEGEVILLLHGYAGSVSHWEPIRPHLSKYYQVVVPNLTHLTLGMEKNTFSDQIEELAKFIRVNFPSGPVHLVGLSYGGALSWGLSCRYPELVGRVVLINPMPPEPRAGFQWLGLRVVLNLPIGKRMVAAMLKTKWGKGLLMTAAEIFRNVANEPSLDRMKSLEGRKLLFMSHLIERFSWILRNENWSMWQHKLEYWIPDTLFICDDQDPLIRFSAYEELAQLMGCDNFFTTSGAGHISVLNSPQLIGWEVMKFFLDKAKQRKSS